MILAALFMAVAIGTGLLAVMLCRARWPYRAPRAAIAFWQAVGLAWGLALIGAALSVGLAPYGAGVVPGLVALTRYGAEPLDPVHHAALTAGLIVSGVLLAALIGSFVEVFTARRRHRALLNLVARDDPGVPGAVVLDHPGAAAYCLPGVHSRVVVSAGTLQLLDGTELAAVLAHEHAHLRERHDLVLLPFTSLRRALPGLHVVREAIAAVALLVEMRADDRARHSYPSRSLARALARFGGVPSPNTPCGALGAADGETVARVRRLVGSQAALSPYACLTVYAAALGLVALPAVLLCLPLGLPIA